MKSPMRHVLTILLFVVLTIVGNILSKQIAIGMMSIYDAGELTHWKKLDATFIFEEIIDATPDQILAKSSDGETYSWNSSIAVCLIEETDCNRWVKDDNGLVYSSDHYVPLNSNLDTCIGLSDKFRSFKDPSGEIHICYFTTVDERTGNDDSSYYALLKDGSIWSWSNTDETLSMYYYLIVLVGFLLSTATFVLIMISPKNAGQRRTNIQAMKTLLLLFLLILLFSCLGFYVGMDIGNLKDKEVKYEPWKQLEGPYKFDEIVDAASDTIWAKSINGKLYSWKSYCDQDEKCEKWVETQEVPAGIHEGNVEQQFDKNIFCPPSHNTFPKEPPFTVNECAVVSYMIFGWNVKYYALLDDGTIWFWDPPVGNDGVNWKGIYSLGGIFAGSIIALFAIVISSTIWKNYTELFAVFTLSSIAGVIGSLLIGCIVLYLHISGILVFWKQIESPYKFSEITNANTNRIWAKSTDGQLYMQDCEYQKDCIWLEINYEPDYLAINEHNRDDLPFHKDSNCPANKYISLLKESPQGIVECVFVWKSDIFMERGQGRYIALLDDGTLSTLQYSNEFRSISLLPYIPYGLVAGILFFSYYWIRQKKSKQN